MIYIDFVAGSHGNYLEFVLNKLLAGDKIDIDTPFNSIGASHNKRVNSYKNNKIFLCGHFYSRNNQDLPLDFNNIVSVEFGPDDLLSLMTVSLLRAGDRNIDDGDLHHNTFFKLTETYYTDLCDNIRKTYSDSIIDSYNRVRGEDWPDIDTPEDFFSIPDRMQKECVEDFGFRVYPLTEKYPHMARNLLREFFKHGFKDTNINGFMLKQIELNSAHASKKNVYTVPFSSFYNKEKFNIELEKIKDFFNLTFVDIDLSKLHNEFMKRQFHVGYKKECDDIVDLIIQRKSAIIPKLSLFRESYINAHIELKTGKVLPIGRDEYFKTTDEFIKLLDEI